MEYIIVEEYDPEEFGNRITALLKDGWELYGSPLLVAYYAKGDKDIEHRTIYAQALTKKDKPLGVLAMGKARRK